ncbi:MAG: (d)CMP kinase [Anaerolineae bacterium]|nr:(d)CMP kinase [Anaerolineae bacterium]
MSTVVAIDGPAASGKSTVGQALAERLGYLFFDTGAMYRAVTLVVLERGIDPANEAPVRAVAESLTIDVKSSNVSDGRLYTVLVDNTDVTWAIRAPAVDANVSQVSAYPGVRAAMTVQQRRLSAKGRVVMVGRDIGTVVIPNAGTKIYLDATVEERARRRWKETQARSGGMRQSYAEVLAAMRQRDHIDSTREVAPLRPAADAIVIDTTMMDLPTVIDVVYGYVVGAREVQEP